jgi:hypothetical protein
VARPVVEHRVVVVTCRHALKRGSRAGCTDHALVQLGWPSGGVVGVEGEVEVGLECLFGVGLREGWSGSADHWLGVEGSAV